MPEAATTPADEATAEKIPATKPFGAFLHEHRGAGLHNELSEGLAEVVAKVLEHQRKGELTVKIKIAPSDVDGAVVVTDELKLKAPEPVPSPTLFYGDGHGNLSRRDPRQPELTGLRDASAS